MKRLEVVEVLEEVEGIVLGLVLDLGQGLVPEDEDLGPDLTQGDALSLDQTREIVPSHDLLGTQEETDLGPDPHPDLKTMTGTRMETDRLPESERLHGLVHALGPVPGLDLEVIKTSELDRT